MPILDDVATYIATQGLGTVKTGAAQPSTPWLIHKGGDAPSDRSDIIVLSEYPGEPPVDEMGSTVGAVPVERPALQVHARHLDYSQARAKAEALWGILHKLADVTLGSTRYLLIAAKGSAAPVGRDASQRWMIGFNCRVLKERG